VKALPALAKTLKSIAASFKLTEDEELAVNLIGSKSLMP